MGLSTEQAQQFNAAAAEARVEFEANWRQWSARDVCLWMERWYKRAAYDRLCKIMREAIDSGRRVISD